MYHFIVNPNARSGRGRQVWEQLEIILKDRGTDYQVFFTRYQNHAVKYVRELTESGERVCLIVLGGDGTVNEVLGGICDLSRVTLGYIPIGSSNDFARSLGLERDPRKALDRLLVPSGYLSLDVGVLEYAAHKRRFAVSSGIGFDAGVCHQVAVSRLKRILNRLRLGKLSYAAVALQLLFSLSPTDLTLTLDGGKTLEFPRSYFAAAMNHPFEGGGFRFCPGADPSDGTLDLIVISGLSKLKVLFLLPTAFRGWHVRFKGIHIFRCKTAQITSKRGLPVHADGEPVLAQQRIRYYLEKDKIRLIKT